MTTRTPLNRPQQCLCIIFCLCLDVAPLTQPTPCCPACPSAGVRLGDSPCRSRRVPLPMEAPLLSTLSWRLSELQLLRRPEPCPPAPRKHSLPPRGQTQASLGPFKCCERAWPWGQFFIQHLINQSYNIISTPLF